MLVDLIKRMVITEKYVYRDPNEKDQFEIRLQKFKEAQEKQKQEQEQEKLKQEQGQEQTQDQGQESGPIKKELVANTKTDETNDNETTANKVEKENQLINVEEDNTLDEINVKQVKSPTYAFDLDVRLTKPQIKILLEKVFNVDIISLNTYIAPMKKKRVGFNQGYKSRYKRAIIKLKPNQKIQNPLDFNLDLNKKLLSESASTE